MVEKKCGAGLKLLSAKLTVDASMNVPSALEGRRQRHADAFIHGNIRPLYIDLVLDPNSSQSLHR